MVPEAKAVVLMHQNYLEGFLKDRFLDLIFKISDSVHLGSGMCISKVLSSDVAVLALEVSL